MQWKESKHCDGAAESGRHMKEYYCFFCILMTKPVMRQKRDKRREAKKAEVSRFREAEPSVCLFNRKERRDGETDEREKMALFTLHQDNNER